MGEETTNSELTRYRLRCLQAELKRRNAEVDQVKEIIKANFVFHPEGKVGLNVVYELIAQTLGRANGPPFKRWVTQVLADEFKVWKITGRNSGRIDRNGFRGICTKEYLEKQLAFVAEYKKAARDRYIANQAPMTSERGKQMGLVGGHGWTREKREGLEKALGLPPQTPIREIRKALEKKLLELADTKTGPEAESISKIESEAKPESKTST